MNEEKKTWEKPELLQIEVVETEAKSPFTAETTAFVTAS